MITVLFPVHREHEFIADALESILTQTFSDFEILVLDNSEAGIDERTWSLSDKIKYVRLQKGIGLSRTLNYGIDMSSSKYLARMDSDDVSKSDRFKLQVDYLEQNPEVSILGGGIEIFGCDLDSNIKVGDRVIRNVGVENVQSYLLSKNPLFHPTVMMRRQILIDNNLLYRHKFDSAEDLDLWIRASRKVKIDSLNEVVLNYRIHSNQYSREASTRSHFLATKLRIQHSIWMIIHKPKHLLKSVKALAKNLRELLKIKKMKPNWD